MQQALFAMLSCETGHPSDGNRQWYDENLIDPAIEALRTALAQPEHSSDCAVHNEPAYPAGECDCGLVSGIVAWADAFDIGREGHDFWVSRQQPAKDGVPLYTNQQREWVGLTDDEIEKCWNDLIATPDFSRLTVTRAVETKLKEKNSG